MIYKDTIPSEKLEITAIALAVCKTFGITTEQLRSKSRKQQLSDARKCVCLIAGKRIPTRRVHDKNTVNSSAASWFLQQDHATIIYSYQIADQLCRINDLFRNAVQLAEGLLDGTMDIDNHNLELRNYTLGYTKRYPDGRPKIIDPSTTMMKYRDRIKLLTEKDFETIRKEYERGRLLNTIAYRMNFPRSFVKYIVMEKQYMRVHRPPRVDRWERVVPKPTMTIDY